MMFVSYDSSLQLIDISGTASVRTILRNVLNVRAHYSSVLVPGVRWFGRGAVGGGSDNPSIPYTIRLHAPACMHA